jgi:glucose/arabinose dehydrogenase
MKISPCRRMAALLSALTLTIVMSTAVRAASVPAGFTDALVASGITWPTTLAVADDGRIFVAEQIGALRVIKNGTLLAAPSSN